MDDDDNNTNNNNNFRAINGGFHNLANADASLLVRYVWLAGQ